MNKFEENIFVREICLRLDASIEHLGPEISTRLDSVRQDVLQLNLPAVEIQPDSLAQKVRNELNDNAGVSAEIEAKLDQIRQQAIARLQTTENTATPTFFVQLQNWFNSQAAALGLAGSRTMLATACVLVTVVSIFYVNFRATGPLSLEDELSLVASAEEFELYENLEFYLWLAENESLNL